MMDEISYENKIKFNEPYELKQEDNLANSNIPYNIPKEIKFNPTPLYIMTVDLDEEKSEKLEIYIDSVPQKLAFEFSKKHNLDFDAMQFLVDEISKLLVHTENQKTTNNIPECIQEVDEDMNSELYRTHDLEKSKMKKEEISIKKEDTSPNRLPFSDKSLTTFTNNEDNKSKNISNNNISHHHNQSNISMSKTNNVSKSSKVEQHRPLDIKQFSYQLFLDKSSKSDYKGTNKTCNDNRKSNIFEKLYQEAKERKINNKQAATIDTVPSKVKNSDISNNYKTTSYPNDKEHINFGERLYMKGIKLKENSSKKIESLKMEKQNMEKEICTFKPSLLENNYESNIELLKGRIANNRTDILLNYQQYKNDQIEKLREKHQKEEVYPFSPKINKNTNTFLNSKINKPNSTGSDINNINTSKPIDLHERYKQRLIKIKMLEESIYKNSFTPTINNNIHLQSTFSERQDAFKKRVREHSEE